MKIPRVWRQRSTWLPLCCVPFVLSVCFLNSEQVFVSSGSPDGRRQIMVLRRPHGPDDSLRIILVDRSQRIVMYDDQSDHLPGVSEVYWAADSNSVGVLVCDSLKGQIIRGYDFLERRSSPPSSVVDGLRSTLAKRYRRSASRPSPQSDPLLWACDDSSDAFARFKRIIGARHLLPSMNNGDI